MDAVIGETLGILVVLGFYFFPFLIAWARDHRQVLAIFALNLFLGWTFVGWVIALVWALIRPAEEPILTLTREAPPQKKRGG